MKVHREGIWRHSAPIQEAGREGPGGPKDASVAVAASPSPDTVAASHPLVEATKAAARADLRQAAWQAPVGTALAGLGLYVLSQLGLHAVTDAAGQAKLLLGVTVPVGSGLGLVAASISHFFVGISRHLLAAGSWQECSQTYTYGDSPTLARATVRSLTRKGLTQPVSHDVEFRSGAHLVSEYERLGAYPRQTRLVHADGSVKELGTRQVVVDDSQVRLTGFRSQTFHRDGTMELTFPHDSADTERPVRVKLGSRGQLAHPAPPIAFEDVSSMATAHVAAVSHNTDVT